MSNPEKKGRSRRRERPVGEPSAQTDNYTTKICYSSEKAKRDGRDLARVLHSLKLQQHFEPFHRVFEAMQEQHEPFFVPEFHRAFAERLRELKRGVMV